MRKLRADRSEVRRDERQCCLHPACQSPEGRQDTRRGQQDTWEVGRRVDVMQSEHAPRVGLGSARGTPPREASALEVLEARLEGEQLRLLDAVNIRRGTSAARPRPAAATIAAIAIAVAAAGGVILLAADHTVTVGASGTVCAICTVRTICTVGAV